LLHEVQNGAGHSFTPRPYAGSTPQRWLQMASTGRPGPSGKPRLRVRKFLFERGFIASRPEEDGGNGENFVLTERGSRSEPDRQQHPGFRPPARSP
jgi:hypothetical protein